MFVIEGLARQDAADRVDLGVEEALVLGQSQHALALGVVQELAPGVEQLQRIPLPGVMRSGDDDAAVGPVADHGHLGSGSGAEAHVDYIRAAAQQRALDQVVHHLARDAGVAAHHDSQSFAVVLLCHEAHVCRRKFHHVDRREVLSDRAADGSANTGDRFNECHRFMKVKKIICQYTYIKEILVFSLIFDVNILLLCQLKKLKTDFL